MRLTVAWMLGLFLLLPGCLNGTPNGPGGTNGGTDDPDQNATLEAFSRDYDLTFTGMYSPAFREEVEQIMSNCIWIENWQQAGLQYLNVTATQAEGNVMQGWSLWVSAPDWEVVETGNLPLRIELNETSLPNGSSDLVVFVFAHDDQARVALHETVSATVAGALTKPESLIMSDAGEGACSGSI